jgi:hypothetical protein
VNVLLVITYAGDVTASIKDCGTQCPYRLNERGNTELVIEAHAKVNGLDEAISLMQMLGVVDEARAHGEIIDLKWFSKSKDGEATEATPLKCEDWLQ